MTCCLEKLHTFIFDDLTNSQYESLIPILESIGYGKAQSRALIREAIYFGTLELNHITTESAESLVEFSDKEKINYIIK